MKCVVNEKSWNHVHSRKRPGRSEGIKRVPNVLTSSRRQLRKHRRNLMKNFKLQTRLQPRSVVRVSRKSSCQILSILEFLRFVILTLRHSHTTLQPTLIVDGDTRTPLFVYLCVSPRLPNWRLVDRCKDENAISNFSESMGYSCPRGCRI